MKLLRLLFVALACALVAAPTTFAVTPEAVTTTYRVQQSVTLSGIPAGAKSVKWWISIPQDERNQDLLDFAVVSAPAAWTVVRDTERGNRFLFVEVTAPNAASLTTNVEFLLRRRSTFTEIDAAKVGPLTAASRGLFAEDLRKDAPHMEVSPEIVALADKACGAETNIATQANLLLNLVADCADHYSKDPTKPKFSPGDAASCLARGGGTCTDMHSLFIALARAREIPARLQMGYRLNPANEGKAVDPGYRCWAEYFVPNYGWVPTDIVEADNPKGLGRARWFAGLTERRLWLNAGRELDFAGRAVTSHRVNLMAIGYAEIDGVEARVLPDGDKPAQLSRTVLFTEVKPVAVASTGVPAEPKQL